MEHIWKLIDKEKFDKLNLVAIEILPNEEFQVAFIENVSDDFELTKAKLFLYEYASALHTEQKITNEEFVSLIEKIEITPEMITTYNFEYANNSLN